MGSIADRTIDAAVVTNDGVNTVSVHFYFFVAGRARSGKRPYDRFFTVGFGDYLYDRSTMTRPRRHRIDDHFFEYTPTG